MTDRIETQFGTAKDLGSTYTLVGAAVVAGHKYVMHLNVANLQASIVKLRAYVASSGWSSGAPSGSSKVAAIAFDLPIAANTVQQVTGIVMVAGQQLVVYSDTGSGLDIIASGVDITL